MSNCSNHKKDLFGQTDMKVVAEAIGDLHYETLATLLWELQTKIHNDSMRDFKAQKFKLAHSLQRASKWIYEASVDIGTAYEISKPFMKQ